MKKAKASKRVPVKPSETQRKGHGKERCWTEKLEEFVRALGPSSQPVYVQGKGWLVDGALYSQLLGSAQSPQGSSLPLTPESVAQLASNLAAKNTPELRASDLLPDAIVLLAQAAAALRDFESDLRDHYTPDRDDRIYTITEACTRLGFAKGVTLRNRIAKVRPNWKPPGAGVLLDLGVRSQWIQANNVPTSWVDWVVNRRRPSQKWITMDLIRDVESADVEMMSSRGKKGKEAQELASKNAQAKYSETHSVHLPGPGDNSQ